MWEQGPWRVSEVQSLETNKRLADDHDGELGVCFATLAAEARRDCRLDGVGGASHAGPSPEVIFE